MYFNVNFNVFFKLIKVHLLVSELYIYQNARCNDENPLVLLSFLWFLKHKSKRNTHNPELQKLIFVETVYICCIQHDMCAFLL